MARYWVYSFIFRTSDFRNLGVYRAAMTYTGFRGNQRNQIPQSQLWDFKLHSLKFCKKIGLLRESVGHDLTLPTRDWLPSGAQREISQRAQVREWKGRKGREGGGTCSHSPSSGLHSIQATERNRRGLKHAFRRAVNGNGQERVSEHRFWDSFYRELLHPRSVTER